MVEGQLIVKLFAVSNVLFLGGEFAGDEEKRGDKDGKRGRKIVVVYYSCQMNCVPAAEAEKG